MTLPSSPSKIVPQLIDQEENEIVKPCRGGGAIVIFDKTKVLSPEQTSQTAHDLALKHGFTVKRVFKCCRRGFSIKGVVPDDIVEHLKQEDSVKSVEVDIEFRASSVTSPSHSWSLRRLGLDPNQIQTENVDAHVIVLDTGVQHDHPLLNVVEMLSFIDDEPDPADFNGHGTMSAGCATGTAPGVKIHSYKVLGKDGGGCLSDVMSGIERAVEFKQESGEEKIVLNLSLGAFVGRTSYIALDEELYDAVVDHGMTAVVAAGNSSKDTMLYSPGHVKEAITVGAYDERDNFSSFSNYGRDVDILAPGTDIPTTTIHSGSTRTSGTSFAAPFVAGLAASHIWKTKLQGNPCPKPESVREHLIETAKEAVRLGKNDTIKGVPTFPVTTSLSAHTEIPQEE